MLLPRLRDSLTGNPAQPEPGAQDRRTALDISDCGISILEDLRSTTFDLRSKRQSRRAR